MTERSQYNLCDGCGWVCENHPNLSWDVEAELPKDKPPLHAIAGMPFPLSMVAMRKFYNKDWHKPEADGETPSKIRVMIEYSHRETDYWDCEVEALTEAEAKEKGEREFDKATTWQNDVEIGEITTEVVEVQQ